MNVDHWSSQSLPAIFSHSPREASPGRCSDWRHFSARGFNIKNSWRNMGISWKHAKLCRCKMSVKIMESHGRNAGFRDQDSTATGPPEMPKYHLYYAQIWTHFWLCNTSLWAKPMANLQQKKQYLFYIPLNNRPENQGLPKQSTQRSHCVLYGSMFHVTTITSP
jgi:hypothetical protein